MELPQRKPNRLSDYDYDQNGAYFVTVCTQDRRKILSTIVGDGSPVPKPAGMIAETMIAQIPDKYPSVSVDKYVIMPDHIHIIISLLCHHTALYRHRTTTNRAGYFQSHTVDIKPGSHKRLPGYHFTDQATAFS